MTKIPTVRERYEEKFGWANSFGTFTGIRDEEIVKFITAEREAGAREVLLSMQKIVAESRTVEEEYGIGNGEATARAQVIADIQALTPPTK